MTPGERFVHVREAVRAASRAAGRDAGAVRLLPVSKTQPAGAVRAVMAAGGHQFGENRVQEMTAKAGEVDGAAWVLIGHLQRNKAAAACAVMSELQSLDSVALARALETWYAGHRPEARLRVLVEVNTSGEPSKWGAHPGAVAEFTRELRSYPHLDVRGLMTVAHPDPDRARLGFAALAGLRDQLRDRDGGGWDELSMGMSGDYAAAIAAGSTCVRIGTAIFGDRQ
ncbi:MAG: YggS family pyridoxal phosphate-dependent enzyme [Propionibacteriaceae bacterium]|jgi:pyridoxal phosphate enzyme (YggS family)|nr:YggS family pyridoxal phosphate-dependent enzyme [Propionibacteriaceae bacterium]